MKTLLEEHWVSLGFRKSDPGKEWIWSLLIRNQYLTLRRRVNLEADSVSAMNPENVATNFTWIRAFVWKEEIDATGNFNLDELGFWIRAISLRRAKFVVTKGLRENTAETKFRGTCDHDIVKPIVSPAGKIYTPLVVLSRTEGKYRKRSDSSWETPSEFLAQPKFCLSGMWPESILTTFFTWAKHFVSETKYLQRKGTKIVLVMYGYSEPVSCKTLTMLGDTGIAVVGLPFLKTNILQLLFKLVCLGRSRRSSDDY